MRLDLIKMYLILDAGLSFFLLIQSKTIEIAEASQCLVILTHQRLIRFKSSILLSLPSFLLLILRDKGESHRCAIVRRTLKYYLLIVLLQNLFCIIDIDTHCTDTVMGVPIVIDRSTLLGQTLVVFAINCEESLNNIQLIIT